MTRTLKNLATQIGATPHGDILFVPASLTALDETDSLALSPLFRKSALQRAPRLPGAVLSDAKTFAFALEQGVRAALVHDTPMTALSALIDIFYPEEDVEAYVHPSAHVHPTAKLHPSVRVGMGAVVEASVEIGEGSIIEAGAVICSGSTLGKDVRIGPNAVIGYEGFGFVPTESGPVKIRQVGRVIIEDEVEVGACACIDRGTLGATRIGRGTKIDNLVQVGHNARIGKSVMLAGQVGIAGSVTIEDGVLMGGQAGAADHLIIGANAKIAAGSGLIADVPKRATVAGYPAMERMRWLRFFAETKKNRSPKP